MIRAIALEGVWRTGRVSERHIGVRPEQIEGVSRQAGRLMLRLPVKDMQRHVMAGAPIGELGAGGSINMDLPIHCREGFEIVFPVERHPRQPVAALRNSRAGLSQPIRDRGAITPAPITIVLIICISSGQNGNVMRPSGHYQRTSGRKPSGSAKVENMASTVRDALLTRVRS